MMGQYDLNSASIFLSVIRAGSFRKAAENIGIPKSNVSRKVSELETSLGAKLLNRTTRSISLTDAGRIFIKHAELAIAHFNEAERAVLELSRQPQGQLRVTATVSMGQHFLSSLITRFLEKFPEIKINLHLTDREVDLISERFDVAIRIGKLQDSALVAKLIGKSTYRLVASPAYLKKNGMPKSPDDLRSHSCLQYSHSGGATLNDWPFRVGKVNKEISVTGQFISDDFLALREAALGGVGIARLPSHVVKDHLNTKKLISILDFYAPPATPIHLIHMGGRHLPFSTRTFIDFVYPQLTKAFGDI